MHWNKKEIAIKDIPGLISTFQNLVKAGNPNIETFRCLYKLEDEVIYHMLTVFDFMDNLPTETITTFILYQMVE